MSTTLAVPGHTNLPATQPRGNALAPLNLNDALLLADHLFRSQFAPRSFKSSADVLAALLLGRELALGPMQSLRSVHIVDGKATVAADIQLALFQRSGGKAEWLKLDNTGAEIRLTHPTSGMTISRAFTMEDAARASLTNKDNWKKYPRDMCRSRAITGALKDIGFEPTAGLYDPEELGGPATIIEAEEATPETLDTISEALADLSGLVPQTGRTAMKYYAANYNTIAADEDEARKFLRGLIKRIGDAKQALQVPVVAAPAVVVVEEVTVAAPVATRTPEAEVGPATPATSSEMTMAQIEVVMALLVKAHPNDSGVRKAVATFARHRAEFEQDEAAADRFLAALDTVQAEAEAKADGPDTIAA